MLLDKRHEYSPALDALHEARLKCVAPQHDPK